MFTKRKLLHIKPIISFFIVISLLSFSHILVGGIDFETEELEGQQKIESLDNLSL